jgi:predicted Zn-dependent protease
VSSPEAQSHESRNCTDPTGDRFDGGGRRIGCSESLKRCGKISSQKPRTAAFVTLVTVLCFAAASEAGQSRRVLAELGRLEPPAYAAPLLRTEPAPVFDEAMQAYAERRFERAADVLRRFVTSEPDDPAANFYLAVSLMMTDDVGEAEDRLGVVLQAGETPFEAAARFVLAKARIRNGDLASAERELVRLPQGTDSYARSAAELLPKVRAAKRRE